MEIIEDMDAHSIASIECVSCPIEFAEQGNVEHSKAKSGSNPKGYWIHRSLTETLKFWGSQRNYSALPRRHSLYFYFHIVCTFRSSTSAIS